MFEAKTLTMGNAAEIAEWCGGVSVAEHDALDHSVETPGVNVPCGEEVKRASLGDTILKHSDGNFDVLRNGKGISR